MVLLDVDFNEGDILTAGVITSTSSVNGITTTINSNTLTKLKYVGSDTVDTINNSVAETTLATVLIPANTVVRGIIVSSSVQVSAGAAVNSGTFRVKIGPTGSEATKQTVILVAAPAGSRDGGSCLFYDNTQTWNADVTVLITGQNSVDGSTDVSTCYQLVVTGD